MKKSTAITIALFGVVLFVVQMAQGQGTLYVSNLRSTPTGGASVGSDAWVAQSFVTGNDSGSFAPNSIELVMQTASGSPSGFGVSIYSDLNGSPYNDLATFTDTSTGSSSPSAAGIYTYTISGLTLASSTEYFIVVTAATPVAQGAYAWSDTSGVGTSIDQWSLQTSLESSDAGLNWTANPTGNFFQLGISATPVPEPSPWILCLLGGGFAFYVHARKRPTSQGKLD